MGYGYTEKKNQKKNIRNDETEKVPKVHFCIYCLW